MFKGVVLTSVIVLFAVICPGQNGGKKTTAKTGPHSGSIPIHVCARCVRAHMDFLASDALRGRGSGTHDELVAATYIASELEQYGIAAAEDGGYLQAVSLLQRKVTGPPQLSFKSAGSGEMTTWSHGNEIVVLKLGAASFSGPLEKIDPGKPPSQALPANAVVLLTGTQNARQAAFRLAAQGAGVVIVPASAELEAKWASLGRKFPELPVEIAGVEHGGGLGESFAYIAANSEAAVALAKVPEGTTITITAPASEPETSHTWNVIGRIEGKDPTNEHQVVLFTAHLDHLGIGPAVHGDDVYNGADDDASGTTAVLELARVLAGQPTPRRTVVFALFGSEETGGLGSTYFRQHPPMPLKDVVAYLEFEMIGRGDPAVPENTLWLTGWNRSDLGPALASHGAHLVADPHPNQHFFERSDNYVFAKQGVVAQTVSSYGLHSDYHEPSDDLAHINFQHMDEAIDSMLEPVLWLVNSDFVPKWKQGGKP